MKYFITKGKFPNRKFLGKNSEWLSPFDVAPIDLIQLSYSEANELSRQMRHRIPSVSFTNGITEKIALAQDLNGKVRTIKD